MLPPIRKREPIEQVGGAKRALKPALKDSALGSELLEMHQYHRPRGRVAVWLAVAAAVFVASSVGRAAENPRSVQVGYAAITPATVILKEKGWLEAELAPRGIAVNWVLVLGSNKAIEFLRGKSLDFASSSNASAFLARANGTPIKLVYWTHHQNGAPILVRADSPYRAFADLKGKKIAATPGTGPYMGLIAALEKHGMTAADVEIVPLQHPQGRLALAAGRVDAWAGLEPDWSIAEIEIKARILFIDPQLPGGGVIDVRDEFARQYPDITDIVLKGFERARLYSLEHPEEALKVYTDGSRLAPEVARRSFERNDLTQPAVRASDADGLALWGKLFKTIGAIPPDTDVDAIARQTIDTSFNGSIAQGH